VSTNTALDAASARPTCTVICMIFIHVSFVFVARLYRFLAWSFWLLVRVSGFRWQASRSPIT
jgi:hypothetical protein